MDIFLEEYRTDGMDRKFAHFVTGRCPREGTT